MLELVSDKIIRLLKPWYVLSTMFLTFGDLKLYTFLKKYVLIKKGKYFDFHTFFILLSLQNFEEYFMKMLLSELLKKKTKKT